MDLNGISKEKLKNEIIKLGYPSYRAEQIFMFFHQKLGKDILLCPSLPKQIRKELETKFSVGKVSIAETFESKVDDTKKFLFMLEDEEIIEGVLMKYAHGFSQCISTQIGCKMGCSFCASTKQGCVRNLSSAEMLEQIYEVEREFNLDVSNIILMGSGEPLDNFDEVLNFLHILHDEKGKNMSFRNMTISTCGIAPKIIELAKYNLPITLAISLHSLRSEVRKDMMPITNKYSIEEVLSACKYYFQKTKRRVTFEYTLIDGVNNLEEDIFALKKYLGVMPHHINLIPLNSIEEYNKERPSLKKIKQFQKELKKQGLSVTIRRELGADIQASCGQLRRRYQIDGEGAII